MVESMTVAGLRQKVASLTTEREALVKRVTDAEMALAERVAQDASAPKCNMAARIVSCVPCGGNR